MIQLERIEMHILGDVGPALASQISQQSQFPAAARFSRSDKIEPAVIVVIENGNSPAALPAEIGERNVLQPLPFHIPPQADARRTRMRERQIHPAVFIEVERHHTHRRRQLLFVEIDAAERREFPFAGIAIDRSSCLPARDDEVNCPVVVKISADNPSARGCKTERRLRGHVRECAIAVVAPKNIVRRRARRS